MKGPDKIYIGDNEPLSLTDEEDKSPKKENYRAVKARTNFLYALLQIILKKNGSRKRLELTTQRKRIFEVS